MKCNGTYWLQVQTRHGEFNFPNQKFHSPEQGSSAFLKATEDCQSAVTRGLTALAVETCMDAQSYTKSRQALSEVTGESLLCRQTLCNWVKKTADRIDKLITEQVAETAEIPMPPLAAKIDLYDPKTLELQIFEDGILVKAQKPTHEKQGEPRKDKPYQFCQSYFGLVPLPDGRYQFVMGSSDDTVSLSDCLRSFVCRHWSASSEPLPLVAITDGARDLRKDLHSAFGEITVLLDWYHLRKKTCECASMLVSTKEARTELKKKLLKLLYHGQVPEALQVLADLPIRNAMMHNKLITYLTNHAHEIIDYERRSKAQKTIGSGRMEKGVDQVIGQRQKDRGMSWSKRGSYALGQLTAYRANGQWGQLWTTSEMAT